MNPLAVMVLASGGWLVAAGMFARFGVWPLAKRADEQRADDLLPTDDLMSVADAVQGAASTREWAAQDAEQAKARRSAELRQRHAADLEEWRRELGWTKR